MHKESSVLKKQMKEDFWGQKWTWDNGSSIKYLINNSWKYLTALPEKR